MSTLVSDTGPPDRPLEPWERFQLATWIAAARAQGFVDLADEADRAWRRPEVWREMRGEIARRARRAV